MKPLDQTKTSRQQFTKYVVDYDYNFKGKKTHCSIVITDHQLKGELQSAKDHGAWNIRYELYLPE